MADLQRTSITSDLAPQPLGAYSVGMSVNAGKLIYVAGQVGVDLSGALVGPGDAAAQNAPGLSEHRRRAAIRPAPGSTTWWSSRPMWWGAIRCRASSTEETRFSRTSSHNGDYPPNTLLVVDGLVREEFLVEIKAVAALA